MSKWNNPWDFPVPALGPGVIEADQMLAENVHNAMVNAGSNFIPLNNPPDEQYSSPRAFQTALINYAVDLKHGFSARKFAPPDWDAVKAGFAAADAGIEFLKNLPERLGDDNARSIYDVWTNSPVVAKPVVDPKVTGSDAAPFSPIFGGKQQS